MASRPTNVAQVLIGTAATMALFYFLRAMLIPFVIAFVLAVLVSALVRFLRARWPKAPGWAVSLLAGLAIVLTASGSIFVVAQGAAQVFSQGPALMHRLDEIVASAGRSLHLAAPLRLATLVGTVSVSKVAGSILSSLQGLASGLLLMVVYFGFLLAGRTRIGRKIDAIAGSSRKGATIRKVVARIEQDIETYVWVQTVTGLIITVSAVIAMMAVGLHNVLFWAVIFFLLTFIPTIGVTIGSIAPALFALLQFPTPWQAITIFAVIQVVATVVGNLFYPRLQAETQNIDPVATLLSLSFWGLLWGVPGAFLAVPLTLMLMMVFAQFESTQWVAALLSNDGRPDLQVLGRVARSRAGKRKAPAERTGASP